MASTGHIPLTDSWGANFQRPLGVTVGAYWEIFEWFFVGKYTMADTISDLLVDSTGALAAALVALVLRRRGDRLT